MGKKEAGEKECRTISLNPDQKLLLLRSIAQHLDRCGFSKCLKKFLSEAEIEKQDLVNTLPDLEEIYCEYLKKKNDHEAGDSIKQKTEEVQTNGKKEAENSSDDYEKRKKDKNKKKKEPKSEVTQESSIDGSSKNMIGTDVKIEEPKDTHEDAEKGKKDKKKEKKASKTEVTEEKVKEGLSENEKETVVEIGEGKKDKKKKKKSKSSDDAITHEENEGEKVSKKRKRPETEEENEQTVNDQEDEESKRRKKEDGFDVDAGGQETPAKQQPEVQENGNVENSGAKSANQKSGKKQLTGSKEPKKPFQRVNVEEVEFIDERLKDNSYWAKDGADSGYGAKAQEVLGQVRGRGFRHEKTKKKRGTYRGGQIDLHSHSVKFSYSDDE